MATNTVEATLRSTYSDGVSKALEATRNALQQHLTMMTNAGATMEAGFTAAFDSAVAKLDSWQRQLKTAADQSDNEFKRISLGAAAMAVAFGSVTLSLLRSVGSFLASLAKEASDVTELKLAYEGLTQSVGWHVDTIGRLKTATENLVSSTDLLKNANRVMQSGVQVSDKMYVELTENVFRLAKSARADGAQALNTLTDALIRGNARGFQTIGIAINVKDAVSEMAMATGQHTQTLQNSARMQAFYNELLEKTREAAAKLPPDFISIDDAITRGEKAWRSWFVAVGESINRSAVFQELTKKLLDKLTEFGSKQKDMDALTLSVNRFFVATLNGFSTVIILLSAAMDVWDVAWATIKTAALLGSSVIIISLGSILEGIRVVFWGLSKLGGEWGAEYGRIASDIGQATDLLRSTLAKNVKDISGSWTGLGQLGEKIYVVGQNAKATAVELQEYVDRIVRGTGAASDHANVTANAVELQKKLNEQMKRYGELLKELQLRNASPEAKAMSELAAALSQIESLTLVSEERKNTLRRLAYKNWLAEKLKLERDAANKEAELLKEALDISRAIATSSIPDLKTWQTPSILGSQPKNLGDDTAYRVSRDADLARRKEWEAVQAAAGNNRGRNGQDTAWLDQFAKTHDQLQKLNALKMDPFHQTMSAMKNSVVDFAGQAGEAFANFFADLASGQENAGKKLLAAFLSMIGQMLVKTGVLLIQTGIAEMALASTVVGRFMGASHAAGARALATGIILSAIGGVMMGAASSMAQTSSAGESGTYQNIASPTSSTVQVINVGAAGRAQTTGETSSSGGKTFLGELVVKVERGLIVNEVKTNIQRNGELRTVIQNVD